MVNVQHVNILFVLFLLLQNNTETLNLGQGNCRQILKQLIFMSSVNNLFFYAYMYMSLTNYHFNFTKCCKFLKKYAV